MGLSPNKTMTARHTSQRQAVLRTVKLSPAPVTAGTVASVLKTHGVGRSTVFRNLDLLVGQGEIILIESPDGVGRYVGHPWHEAEFRCIRCGKKRHLRHRTLTGYVDRKMFGHQRIISSQLTAQGLCGACARSHHPRRDPSSGRRGG